MEEMRERERAMAEEEERGAVFLAKNERISHIYLPLRFTLSPLNFQMCFKHTQYILPLSH